MIIKLNLTEFEARLLHAALDRPDLAHIGDIVYNPKGDTNSGEKLQRISDKLRKSLGD